MCDQSCGTADRVMDGNLPQKFERRPTGMLVLNAARRLVQRIPRTISLICTTLSLLLGFLVYYLWMELDPVDAIYLTVVTISTVGYGDINPSQMCVDDEGNDISDSTNCVGLRLFTCLYILFGCGYVFAQLANVFGGVLVAFSDMVKRLLDKLDTTPTGVDTSGDGKIDTQVAGRSVGLSGKARDLTGDGNIDFIEPPTALIYWMQEMVPALLLLMIVQVVSAIIFAQLLPEVNFATALYHCFITATTVGFGDVKLTTRARTVE